MSKKQELMPAIDMTSGEFDRVFLHALERKLTGWTHEGFLVRSTGVIGSLERARKTARASGYSKLYGVTVAEKESSFTCTVSKTLLESYNDGEYVEVVGYPKINVYRSTISLQLELISVSRAESEADVGRRREVQSNLAALQSLRPVRNAFPLQPMLSMDVIHSGASAAQVDEDFYNGLGDQVGRCKINSLPVRITSAEEIAKAIRSSEADIVVIIRGGGPDSDFAVFNDAEVLTALSEKKSYRVMGIGHSGNTTLIDLIADFAASVPAEAGTHIRDHLRHLDGLVGMYEESISKRNSQIGALTAEVKKTRDQANAEISRLHDSFKDSKQQPQPQPQPRNKLLWIVIAALVLMLILK